MPISTMHLADGTPQADIKACEEVDHAAVAHVLKLAEKLEAGLHGKVGLLFGLMA